MPDEPDKLAAFDSWATIIGTLNYAQDDAGKTFQVLKTWKVLCT